MTLIIDRTIFDTLVAHAERDWPEECCGILVGRRIGVKVTINGAVPSPNIAQGDRRRNYQIDWQTLLRTQRRARTERVAIVGFYHSHTDGTTRPSSPDADHAWPDCSYFIAGVSAGRCTGYASWRLSAGQGAFESECIAVSDQVATE